jgi:hypothetical protein
VDNLRTQIKLTEPAQIPLQPQVPDRKPVSAKASVPALAKPAVSPLTKPGGAKRVSESRSAYRQPAPPVEDSDIDFNDMPPPPDNPPEWDTYAPAEMTKFPVPDLIAHEPELPEETSEPSPVGSAIPTVEQSSIVYRPSSVEPIAPKLNPLPPVTIPADDHAPQMVTIILRPTGDADRDIRRIQRLHGTFISFPGKDRFAFHVFEEGKGHLIEFPNDTTRVCAELLKKVKDFVDEENIRIEPITYQ